MTDVRSAMMRFVRAGARRLRSRRAPIADPLAALPQDYDAQTVAMIRAVGPYTMTSAEKLYALCNAVRYVHRYAIPGAIVECGVFRGGSMMAAALTLLEAGDRSRELFLFDTFEGMPQPAEVDRYIDGRSAREFLGEEVSGLASVALEDVLDAMKSTGYPENLIHLVKGRVEDTIPHAAPQTIAILRLDTDWYSSTRHELMHLYHRVSSGGVLIVDDYGTWQGSKKALDEFIDATGHRLLLTRIDEGRIAVVP